MGIAKMRRWCPEDGHNVLAERRTPNHILHLLLSLFTGGIWLFVWLFVSLS